VYSSANAKPCSMPICVSLMCKSRFIGSTSSEIVVRSMKENMYISISTATLYQAAKEVGYEDESLLAAMSTLDCAGDCARLKRVPTRAANRPLQYPYAQGRISPAI
jgi:hypothetical protein